MGRRVVVSEPHIGDEKELRRRYRQLEVRLCVPACEAPEQAEQVRSIGLNLRREAARTTDPMERLELAERAYLTVFSQLPWEGTGGVPDTHRHGVGQLMGRARQDIQHRGGSKNDALHS